MVTGSSDTVIHKCCMTLSLKGTIFHCATQSSALCPCNDHGTMLPTVLSGSSPILVPLTQFLEIELVQ